MQQIVIPVAAKKNSDATNRQLDCNKNKLLHRNSLCCTWVTTTKRNTLCSNWGKGQQNWENLSNKLPEEQWVWAVATSLSDGWSYCFIASRRAQIRLRQGQPNAFLIATVTALSPCAHQRRKRKSSQSQRLATAQGLCHRYHECSRRCSTRAPLPAIDYVSNEPCFKVKHGGEAWVSSLRLLLSLQI